MTNRALFWERQTSETARAYAAFCVYRDLGPTRSLRKAAEEFYTGKRTVDHRQFKRWSSANLWVVRAEAYDAEMDRRRRLEREEQIKDALDRARKSALLLQTIALNGLQLYCANSVGDPPMVLLRYLQAGLAEERLALGIPSDITKLDARLEHRGGRDTMQDFETRRRIDSYRTARQVFES